MEALLLAVILIWVLISHRRAELRRRKRLARCRRIERLMEQKSFFDIELPQKARVICLADYRKTGT